MIVDKLQPFMGRLIRLQVTDPSLLHPAGRSND